MWFKRKHAKETDVLGLRLSSPVGSREKMYSGAGFVTLTPPSDGVLNWIQELGQYRHESAIAVNISADIIRNFSLVYDFADLIIIDPDGDNGIDSPDLADTSQLIDEVVSLRLCYENYTPVALRLSHGHTPDEIKALLDHCRMSGIDAIVAPGAAKVRFVASQTAGRLPIIGSAESIEETIDSFSGGACLVEAKIGRFSFKKLLKKISEQ